jgi:hypothetical protein
MDGERMGESTDRRVTTLRLRLITLLYLIERDYPEVALAAEIEHAVMVHADNVPIFSLPRVEAHARDFLAQLESDPPLSKQVLF